MKTFNEVRESFLAEKKISISNKTLIGYKGKLELFNTWLYSCGFSETPMSEITKETIYSFFIHLASVRNLDRPTCEKYYQNIKTLFNYALENGHIDVIPFHKVPLPMKGEDMGAEVISDDHLKLILAEMKKKDPQLFLASMMEYYAFIRPGREMRNMKVGDVNLENGYIRIPAITAKSKRNDTVTMPDHLIQICKEYGLDKADKSLYVFGRRKTFGEKPYNSDTMRYRFDKIKKEYGLPKGYKWYSFKHTGSSKLHQSGTVSMRELMDQLRHTNLSATQHYLKRHSSFINNNIKVNFPSPL